LTDGSSFTESDSGSGRFSTTGDGFLTTVLDVDDAATGFSGLTPPFGVKKLVMLVCLTFGFGVSFVMFPFAEADVTLAPG